MSHINNPRRRHPHAALHLRQNGGNPLDTFNPNNQQTTPTDPNPAATFTPSDFPTPVPVEPSTAQSSTTSSSSVLSLSSSSSSSTSTSTSTSTTSTTSSTSPSVISTTPTPTTTTSLSSSGPASTFTFFQTISSQVANGTQAHPSSTSTSSAVGGATGGIIAGGILAAILGTAGVVFAVVYFLRKCRRNEDEALAEEIWNRPDVLRQSVMLPDEPELVRPYNTMGPGSPRPPTMIERHLNNAPPSVLSRQPQPNMFPNNGYGTGYGAMQYGQPSFSPGEVMSPTSANPFISPYAQDVMTSPVSSVPDYHDLPSPASPALPPPALTRQPSSAMDQAAVVRQNSVTNGPHSPVVSAPDASDPHYVDLSRSSVTPFQAAQYADITEKLRTPMAPVLVPIPNVPRVDTSNDQTLTPQADLPPQEGKAAPTESPFADPGTQQLDVDPSQELDMEVPLPTPILYDHTRISSTPPTLPEIHVPERSFSPVASLEFPVPLSARETPSPFSVEFSDVRTPPPAGLNYKSSPLASSSPTQVQPTVIPREANAESSKRDTVYTLYDEEDAYGGI